MKILILEDSKERIKRFRENFKGHLVVFTYEPQQCIDQLDIDKWDALFLDHDLGGRVMQPSNGDSGYAVAKWLEEHPARKPPIIVIHSLNPVGSLRMQRALPGSLRIPFAWLKEKLFSDPYGSLFIENAML